jgi:heme-degrading monooxygenase HmoA
VIAATPAPPYYAVIFSSLHTGEDEAAYGEMAALMERLAAEQPGYLGHESARSEVGITVSYWTDEDSIRAWKAHVDHAAARRLGRERWYSAYALRVARVERAYTFER